MQQSFSREKRLAGVENGKQCMCGAHHHHQLHHGVFRGEWLGAMRRVDGDQHHQFYLRLLRLITHETNRAP